VKVGKQLYTINTGSVEGEAVDLLPTRQIPSPPPQVSQLDPDQLCSLVLEVIPQGSCLVFCPTKKNCQNVALLLSKCIPK
jgi:POLQ-like helicase